MSKRSDGGAFCVPGLYDGLREAMPPRPTTSRSDLTLGHFNELEIWDDFVLKKAQAV